MKKKKRKMTPEEKAWSDGREARIQELHRLIERGKAELAAKRKTA